MKFRNIGKTLLVAVLSLGIVFGLSSCIRSYTTGYLYVLGTNVASGGGTGYITGYKVNHNQGLLTKLNGLPIGSGGANPIRAVLVSSSRFVYVLNAGSNSSGTTCSASDPCTDANITEFVVGGNGILTAQQTFYTSGTNPIRMVADSSGDYLYVLDQIAPDSATTVQSGQTKNLCQQVLGSTYTSCGDITAFSIDQTTGRLSTLQNSVLTTNNQTNVTYFPVPSNAIDFQFIGSVLYTVAGTPTTGDNYFPLLYTSSTGQLTSYGQTGPTTLGVNNVTAIDAANGNAYILDNDSLTIATGAINFTAGTYLAQVLPFTASSSTGALTSATGGPFPVAATSSAPTQLFMESTSKFMYVATSEQSDSTTSNGNMTGYYFSNSQPAFISGSPFTNASGASPQCIVEDPSHQFIYTASAITGTINGTVLDNNSGVLDPMHKTSSWTLSGPATWCLMDSRVD